MPKFADARRMAPRARFELEPVCGRERSGSPQAKSRAMCARDLSSRGKASQKNWLPGLDSNLSRYAGVSEAGARRRNPERYVRGISLRKASQKNWLPGLDSNLSRYAGVSEAGARRRNPERSARGISLRKASQKNWLPGLDSNLSRYAGVSEAGARRRNPERSARGICRRVAKPRRRIGSPG